jgi:hypothetical protein
VAPLTAARGRIERSWAGALRRQMKDLDVLNQITLFGAALLWSALPLVILLSSLADQRIDDDLSRHIGLDAQGAHIVRTLFREKPAHGVVPIVTGVLFSFAGVIAVVGSLQALYERIFRLEERGWRGLPRWIVWTSALMGVLWWCLAFFSSVYFSPVLVSDSRTYGTIGVVFSLLTWFFLIGGVLVLGAVLGAAWQARADGHVSRHTG